MKSLKKFLVFEAIRHRTDSDTSSISVDILKVRCIQLLYYFFGSCPELKTKFARTSFTVIIVLNLFQNEFPEC